MPSVEGLVREDRYGEGGRPQRYFLCQEICFGAAPSSLGGLLTRTQDSL